MSEGDLTAKSCTVGVVGADTKFLILSEADLEPYVAALKDAEDAPAGFLPTSFAFVHFAFVHWLVIGDPLFQLALAMNWWHKHSACIAISATACLDMQMELMERELQWSHDRLGSSKRLACRL